MSERGRRGLRRRSSDPAESVAGRATSMPRAGRPAAIAGATLAILMILTMAGTAELVSTAQDHDAARLAGGAVAVVLLAALALLPDWDRVPPAGLLVFPVLGLAALAGFGFTIGAVGSYYSGLIVLLFLYTGLTQRPWASLALVPLAIPTWYVLYQGQTGPSIWLRLPIALIIWIAVGEITARHSRLINEQARRLGHLADHDQLTGLSNRRRLPETLARLRPGAAVLLIDVDDFKQVNDRYGHQAGDRLLAEFAGLIRRCVRQSDLAIRYGGEEFLVVLAQGGLAAGQALDDRLRAELAATGDGVTYSAGLTALVPGEPVENSLARADQAMYRAKRDGRNRTELG